MEPLYGPLPTTAVAFTTSDQPTLMLFEHAESCEAKNTKDVSKTKKKKKRRAPLCRPPPGLREYRRYSLQTGPDSV